MLAGSFTISEIKEVFKKKKSLEYDEKRFNSIKNCFSELNMPLKYLFEMSL